MMDSGITCGPWGGVDIAFEIITRVSPGLGRSGSPGAATCSRRSQRRGCHGGDRRQEASAWGLTLTWGCWQGLGLPLGAVTTHRKPFLRRPLLCSEGDGPALHRPASEWSLRERFPWLWGGKPTLRGCGGWKGPAQQLVHDGGTSTRGSDRKTFLSSELRAASQGIGHSLRHWFKTGTRCCNLGIFSLYFVYMEV